MQKTFYFITDPGHGWVKVPLNLLHTLGIADKVTLYSYQRGDFAYLEEDQDASLFHQAFFDKYGEFPVYREQNCMHRRSRVRGYDIYRSTPC